MTILELLQKIERGETTESDALWLSQYLSMIALERVRMSTLQETSALRGRGSAPVQQDSETWKAQSS